MIYLELTMLTVVVVFIVDVSGFLDTIKSWLSKWLDKKVSTLKPFDCSLCMTWWAGIVYAIFQNEFTLPVVTFVCGLAVMAYPISELIQLLQALILRGCNKVADLLKL